MTLIEFEEILNTDIPVISVDEIKGKLLQFANDLTVKKSLRLFILSKCINCYSLIFLNK